MQTALREAQEEVNLDPIHVEVVCTLPPIHSHLHTLTIVNPVVALVSTDTDQLRLVPDPAEVDCLYWVPLEFFLTNAKVADKNGVTHILFNYLDSVTGMEHVIYGVTAYLCNILSAMALGRCLDIKPFMIQQVEEDDEIDSTTLVFALVMVTTDIASKSKL